MIVGNKKDIEEDNSTQFVFQSPSRIGIYIGTLGDLLTSSYMNFINKLYMN